MPGSCALPGTLTKDWAQQVALCDDALLPAGEFTEEQVTRFENFKRHVTPEKAARLARVLVGEAWRSSIAACLGLSKD